MKLAASSWQQAGRAGRQADAYLDKAIEDLTEAIRLNPKMADSYNSRGVVFSDTARFKKAIMDFHKAILLDPNHALAYYNRSLVYSRMGNTIISSYSISRFMAFKGINFLSLACGEFSSCHFSMNYDILET